MVVKNRLSSESHQLIIAAVCIVCTLVFPLWGWWQVSLVTGVAAILACVASTRECSICHRFGTLSDSRYGKVCPTCARLIAEHRQQELLERRS